MKLVHASESLCTAALSVLKISDGNCWIYAAKLSPDTFASTSWVKEKSTLTDVQVHAEGGHCVQVRWLDYEGVVWFDIKEHRPGVRSVSVVVASKPVGSRLSCDCCEGLVQGGR